jgi:hypothetical protein
MDARQEAIARELIEQVFPPGSNSKYESEVQKLTSVETVLEKLDADIESQSDEVYDEASSRRIETLRLVRSVITGMVINGDATKVAILRQVDELEAFYKQEHGDGDDEGDELWLDEILDALKTVRGLVRDVDI